MISRQDLVVDSLLSSGRLTDKELAKEIHTSIRKMQQSCHLITFNKKKFKEFTVLRSGKRANYSRELTTRKSDENKILDSRDYKIKKGLKQFDGARKEGLIGINTREGIKNRNILINRVLNQNLNAMIEAQKLLQ